MIDASDFLSAMHSRPTEESGRESKTLYVVTDNYRVHDYIGWRCDEGDYWWCPDYGYSVMLGVHAFESREEAVSDAMKKIKMAEKELREED